MTSQRTTPSGMRKVVFALLLITLGLFTILDALVFRQFVPHIPVMVSRTLQISNHSFPFPDNETIFHKISSLVFDNSIFDSRTEAEVKPNMLQNGSGLTSFKNRTLISEDLRQKLKKLGYEPAEDHNFKSPYIITPKIYPPVSEDLAKNSYRKTKVMSCFNCPSWFVGKNLDAYTKIFQRCPYSECVYDARGQYKKTADALLFFVGPQGGNMHKVPKRPPGQIWIKCYWESPAHYGYPKNYAPWKSAFNWTFNYRTDSDIFAPNDLFAWRDRDELLSDSEYLEIAKKKTKTAAWWVSHCSTQGKREVYVKEMQKYIDVDIYGGCSKLKCGRDRYDECERMLTTTYKFYLSFENSLCKDYVTEKFFRNFGYRTHVVPVARGGFDYDKYIPNGTFVNAAHFKKAKDLALHLKKLGNDLPTYAKMLKEKDKLVSLGRKYDWCDICEKLHTDTKTKIIPDIRAWSHNGACYPVKDIV